MDLGSRGFYVAATPVGGLLGVWFGGRVVEEGCQWIRPHGRHVSSCHSLLVPHPGLLPISEQNEGGRSAERPDRWHGELPCHGRPNANTRLTLLESFLQYRNLHYRDGVLFLLYYVVYKLANLGLAGSLPMFTIVFSAVCWLVVPTLFAPYPSWSNLFEDVCAVYDFMMRCPSDWSRTELQKRRHWLSGSSSGKRLAVDVAKKGSTGVPGNLFELLVKDAQEKHEKLRYTWDQDLILLVASIVRLVLLLMVLPATIAESFEFCSLVWVLHCFLVLTFGIFLELLCLLTLFILYILAFSVATDFVNVLLALGP